MCVCLYACAFVCLDALWAWGVLEITWANLWANLGQTLANLCVFLANPSGNGLERARIPRKKWDGRHRVKSGKCPYYNTNRARRHFLGWGVGEAEGAGARRPHSPPLPARLLEFYEGTPAF